jgi:putative flavoprotein involved in K+ transport
MNRTETLIIGAGQAGLAMSRSLTDRGRDHVVIERGRIAQSWTQRWDSLRLLTPNWMTRLPGHAYTGDDPKGFMSKDQVIEMLGAYAESFDAPVHERTTVGRVFRWGTDWQVVTDRGTWQARNVVVATGACQMARIPETARNLPADVFQMDTLRYRNPEQFPEGGVLVVGASASGIQLADELHRSGRPVTLAVGSHTRLPRTYRGRDILWWLDRMGTLNRELDTMKDFHSARREPSLQLVGKDEHTSIDLATLAAKSVWLTGRLTGIEDGRASFDGSLAETVRTAEHSLSRILDRIDKYIDRVGMGGEVPAAEPIPPIRVESGPSSIDLAASGIRSVLWATGYRRSYPWLDAPVFDADGEIRQHRGRSEMPGLYTLGLPFMIRRRSPFIDGVGLDAQEIANHICLRSPDGLEIAA